LGTIQRQSTHTHEQSINHGEAENNHDRREYLTAENVRAVAETYFLQRLFLVTFFSHKKSIENKNNMKPNSQPNSKQMSRLHALRALRST
jgi:hypothetical protein